MQGFLLQFLGFIGIATFGFVSCDHLLESLQTDVLLQDGDDFGIHAALALFRHHLQFFTHAGRKTNDDLFVHGGCHVGLCLNSAWCMLHGLLFTLVDHKASSAFLNWIINLGFRF